MKTLIPFVLIAVLLAGCADTKTEKFDAQVAGVMKNAQDETGFRTWMSYSPMMRYSQMQLMARSAGIPLCNENNGSCQELQKRLDY